MRAGLRETRASPGGLRCGKSEEGRELGVLFYGRVSNVALQPHELACSAALEVDLGQS